MPTPTPEQAAFVLNAVTVPALTVEHPITKSVIMAIPADRADYKPDPIVRNAFELAWHIAAAEVRFLQAVANGAFDFSNTAPPSSVSTPADVAAWYSEHFAAAVDRLKAMTGDELVKRIDFRGIFNFPAFVYAQLGLNHSIHHRGQLSMYLRPMGAKVPSIYGESYDARMAREANA